MEKKNEIRKAFVLGKDVEVYVLPTNGKSPKARLIGKFSSIDDINSDPVLDRVFNKEIAGA